MSDRSKLPIHRVDGLNDNLNTITNNISDINQQLNNINIYLTFTGMIVSALNNDAPIGWLLCNGQAINRNEYNKLFEIIGTTYGIGDGSTTFNVPDYRGLLLQMVKGNQQIGTKIEAGLPNITGQFGLSHTGEGAIKPASNSALQNDLGNYPRQTGGIGSSALNLRFNASLSNPIYGKSDTVQPPVSLINYFIKY